MSGTTSISSISVSTQLPEDFTGSTEILDIIERIKSSYPFTLLTKNRIQFEIDKLNGYFWIKDCEGNYVLANRKFAAGFGLKSFQLEGKNESRLLPGYLKDIYKSINDYIISSSNIVIRDGFVFPSQQQTEVGSLQIVEFPLCDIDNSVVAIVGFTRSSDNEGGRGYNRDKSLAESAVEQSSSAIIITDPTGIIRAFSSKVTEFYELKDIQTDISLESLLPEINTFDHPDFLSNNNEAGVSYFFSEKSVPFLIHLKRLLDNDGNTTGYLVRIEEDHSLEIENLKNKGTMYDILMQTSPDPIFIYDVENLRFLDVNPSALKLYGYSRPEFLQMDLTDLYAPEDIQTLLDGTDSNGRPSGPWRHRKKDGSFVFVEISKSGFNYKGITAHFNIVKDVTESLEMKKNARFFEEAFDSVSDMIFVTDAQGFILRTNKSGFTACGFSSNEALRDRPFLSILTDDKRQEAGRFFTRNSEGSSQDAVLRFKHSNGTSFDAAARFIPVMNGNKEAESFHIIAKTLKTGPMENEEDTGVSVNDETLKVQPGNGKTIDTKFFSNVFHEILTPMNVILGFVQEITDNTENPTAEQKEAIEIIEQNRTLLLQTMDTVVEYTHIEQNKLELKKENISFTDILESIESDTRKISGLRKVQLSYGKISSSLSFENDSQRLQELLSIFVSMAMQITREKNIYISAYQYSEEYWTVSLKDNRSSISEHLLNYLNEFFTADENIIRKEFGVSRLRIRLARRLLELLSGKVETIYKGEEAVELAFLFPYFLKNKGQKKEDTRIPKAYEVNAVKEEEKNAVPAQEEIRPEGDRGEGLTREVTAVRKDTYRRMSEELKAADAVTTGDNNRFSFSDVSCLYLEDQLDSQLLFKVQMKELKHLDFAVSFEDAMPLLENHRYDLIVLDMNLQGEYNGLDALRIIRRIPGYENTKIIAVTAYVLPGDKEKFLAAGFNGFVSKPIIKDKLLDAILQC